jgi:hypothetical protein
MNWQTNDPPTDGRQIIIGEWNEQSKRHVYNIVFYHKPMDCFYGGQGLCASRQDIKNWSDIQAPGAD